VRSVVGPQTISKKDAVNDRRNRTNDMSVTLERNTRLKRPTRIGGSDPELPSRGWQTTIDFDAGSGEAPVAASGRRFLRRWFAAGTILVTALLAVLFVANAIKVNELLGSITSVESELDDVKRNNERLRAELLRLMSVEQITRRGKEIGMIQPDLPPVPLRLNGAAGAGEEARSETETGNR